MEAFISNVIAFFNSWCCQEIKNTMHNLHKKVVHNNVCKVSQELYYITIKVKGQELIRCIF